jgi:hypothetical protein
MGGGMHGVPPQMQGMHGVPGMPSGMHGVPGAAGMPGWNAAMQTGAQVTIPGQETAAKKAWIKFRAEWEVLTPIRRALYIMAPFVFSAACFLLFFDDPPAETPKTTTPKTAPSTSMPPNALGAPTGVGLPTSTGPLIAAPVPTADAVAATPNPPASPSSASTTAPLAPGGKKTLERAAADAWAEGNYADAAKMYEDLAANNPGNPAYKEAARILREKMASAPAR